MQKVCDAVISRKARSSAVERAMWGNKPDQKFDFPIHAPKQGKCQRVYTDTRERLILLCLAVTLSFRRFPTVNEC